MSKPDYEVTEAQAIEEGAVVDMTVFGNGIAHFRGEPVRTVSAALFDALRATSEQCPSAVLQMLIDTGGATDTAGPGEPEDWLYATPPKKTLGGAPVWFQRPKPGEWTAFLPADY